MTPQTRAYADLKALAMHLLVEGGQVHGMCELVAFPGEAEADDIPTAYRGRCHGSVVAVKWEDGFLDRVCRRHADDAKTRPRAIVLNPKEAADV